MRINKMINQGISLPILYGNVWRSVWRICKWILGLKGLSRHPQEVSYSPLNTYAEVSEYTVYTQEGYMYSIFQVTGMTEGFLGV